MAVAVGDVTEIPSNQGGGNGDGLTSVTADAPEGALVIGGGFMNTDSGGDDVTAPLTGFTVRGSRPKSDASGWEVLVGNSPGAAATYCQAYVIYLD